MGNTAIGKMIDAYNDSLNRRSEKEELFMTGELTNPGNMRVEAGNWYRKMHPGGPFLKTLRYGQVLTVTGFLVMFALLAI